MLVFLSFLRRALVPRVVDHLSPHPFFSNSVKVLSVKRLLVGWSGRQSREAFTSSITDVAMAVRDTFVATQSTATTQKARQFLSSKVATGTVAWNASSNLTSGMNRSTLTARAIQ